MIYQLNNYHYEINEMLVRSFGEEVYISDDTKCIKAAKSKLEKY